jgi:hypothetical protein
VSDIFIGRKGEYDSVLDLETSLAYLPESDAVFITRFFISAYQEDRLEKEFMIHLFHECIHQALCKLLGKSESKAFDKKEIRYFNDKIEKWLGWRDAFLINHLQILSCARGANS